MVASAKSSEQQSTQTKHTPEYRVRAIAIDEPDEGEDCTIYEYQIVTRHGSVIGRFDEQSDADKFVEARNNYDDVLKGLKTLAPILYNDSPLAASYRDLTPMIEAILANAENRQK